MTADNSYLESSSSIRALLRCLHGAGDMQKNANRFSQLWRAGELSANSVRRAVGLSRVPLAPRHAERLDALLAGMRRRRGPVDAVGKWMPAQEAYGRLLPQEVGRRWAAMRGADPKTLDLSGLSYQVGTRARNARPKLLAQSAATKRVRAPAWERASDKVSNTWEPQIATAYYFPGANKVQAPLRSASMRHELGHWQTRGQSTVGAALSARRALRELEQVDPRFAAAVVGRNTTGYNSRTRGILLDELRAHMAGAKGTGAGARRLRAATALDNPTVSRSTLYRHFPKAPAYHRAHILKERKLQDATLKTVRDAFRGQPDESGALSSLEHLVRNYNMRLPDTASLGAITRYLP